MRGRNAIIGAAVAILGLFGTAYGQEGKVSGEVSLTGVVREGKDSSAKFNEYRDLRDGVYGSVDLRYDEPKNYLYFKAKDVGYGTQSYDLSGGRWDTFRLNVNYDEIPHHFTYDARTFYTGVGTQQLSYGPGAVPNPNPDTWNTFDYSVKRKNLGANLRMDLLNPFYLSVSADQQKKAGVYPLGAAGTSPGGIAIELPTNVDYRTNSFQVETGYSTKPLFVAVSYLYSQFDNANGVQGFRNPATVNTAAATDYLFLPPENDYWKLGLQGGVKLPFQSKFSMDLATSRATSTARLANSYVDNVSAAASNIGIQGLTGIGLSSQDFHGKASTDQYRFVLTSNPVPFLDTKLFYKYYNKSNGSDIIVVTDAGTVMNKLFDYRKDSYGLETGFKLPAHLRLTAAYTYTKTDRARDDLPRNRDNLFDVGLKWTGLGFMSAKVGYEHLDRAADFTGVSTADAPLDAWIRRFDAAPLRRDSYKTSLEFYPLESLSFNIGYQYKQADYQETILGLTDHNAHEFNADVDWQAHKRLRLSGYFDFEQRILKQLQRTGTTDPATAPTATQFNWASDARENTFGYGLAADIGIIPEKLSLKLAHNSVKSDGTVDYTYLVQPIPVAGRTQDNIDLSARDNYRLSNYVAKATYQLTKALSLSAAYAFEEYSYEDSQYTGYKYYLAVAQGGYLTGAYNDPNYHNHVVFLGISLKL